MSKGVLLRRMNRKHFGIEILPRSLWVIEGLALYAGQHLSRNPPLLTKNYLLLGLGAAFLITGLFAWAHVVYSMRRAFFTKDLIVSGLFKYFRHPMYVSIYIMLFGIGLLFFSWEWMIILALFIPIWRVVCRLEEKQMTEIWGQKYIDYRKQAGMFLPRLKREAEK